MQYNTKNKKTITEFFNSNGDEWFTAEQVVGSVDGIGKSTVYRILGELYESGLLLREYSENNACVAYKADKRGCREHFHIKCVSCGKLVHIEDKKTEKELEDVAKSNGFCLDKGKTVLYGVCEKCKENDKNEK